MFEIKGNNFCIKPFGEYLFVHSHEEPCLYIGRGKEDIHMYRGNFKIEDELIEKLPLRTFNYKPYVDGFIITFYNANDIAAEMVITKKNDKFSMNIDIKDKKFNRIWFRVTALKDEYIFGGGEQFSHFNLRGKDFRIWTSEQGVGRNKNEYMSFMANKEEMAGGDYDTTFFPQSSYISSRMYYCIIENTNYQIMNFKKRDYHEFLIWDNKVDVVFQNANNYISLLEKKTLYLGRQQMLPDFAMKGAWLGVQGGSEICKEKVESILKSDARVSAIWIQDWEGINVTSFGQRLRWDWVADYGRYPDLEGLIQEYDKKGLKFLAYINPNIVNTGSLFEEAEQNGYLVRNSSDTGNLTVDFGEFDCGFVDFTNPVAFEWYKQIIIKNILDLGFSGYMSDFGEYLPMDCKLYNGKEPKEMHNEWPVLWAKVNYEALKDSNKLGEAVFFMRAGGMYSQKYSTLIWAGDQNVDFSLDDGLPSVITAALSMGMSGYGVHCSDLGGYTSLYGLKRSKEVLMRWSEFSAFTPVMRTHEGNRPNDNWQIYSDEESINHFAWCTRIHEMLFDYIKVVVSQNSETGIPVMRPLFLHYEDDEQCYKNNYQYLLGKDILVAPVYEEGAKTKKVYLPKDNWVHLFTGENFIGGYVEVTASYGKTPAFYRENSEFKDLFKTFAEKGGYVFD